MMQNYISDYFFQSLKSHGLAAGKNGDWVTFGNAFPAFRALYQRPSKETTSGSLSVQVMLDNDTLIEGCFAAFGASDKEAVTGALEQFMVAMFHPIIAASCDYPTNNHVTKETWKLGVFSKADIWAGNIATRMTADVKLDTPLDWLDEISNALKRTKLRKGWSWMSLYCSRLDDNPLIASASLNNKAWPDGLITTRALDWPTIKGFYGARMFILLAR